MLGGPMTHWGLRMGTILLLSVQPHSQRVPGIRRPGHKAEHSLPLIAEVKNEWIYTYTSTYAFMVFTAYLIFLTLCVRSDGS